MRKAISVLGAKCTFWKKLQVKWNWSQLSVNEPTWPKLNTRIYKLFLTPVSNVFEIILLPIYIYYIYNYFIILETQVKRLNLFGLDTHLEQKVRSRLWSWEELREHPEII